MTIIIIGLCALGAFETYVYRENKYAEDFLLSFVSFGIAMFFTFLKVNFVWL